MFFRLTEAGAEMLSGYVLDLPKGETVAFTSCNNCDH